MQLMRPEFNANGKSKTKPTAKQLKAKAEHEAWLKANGVHPDQLEKQRRGKISKLFSQPVSTPDSPDLSGVGVTGLKKAENTYTGDNLIGIAVMHKSCLQPVFSKQAAKDSANMRRG